MNATGAGAALSLLTRGAGYFIADFMNRQKLSAAVLGSDPARLKM